MVYTFEDGAGHRLDIFTTHEDHEGIGIDRKACRPYQCYAKSQEFWRDDRSEEFWLQEHVTTFEEFGYRMIKESDDNGS